MKNFYQDTTVTPELYAKNNNDMMAIGDDLVTYNT